MAYTLTGKYALMGALIFAIFGVSAVLPALNTFTTELFPQKFAVMPSLGPTISLDVLAT